MGDGTIAEIENLAYARGKHDAKQELSEPVYRCKVFKYKNSKGLHIILPENGALKIVLRLAI